MSLAGRAAHKLIEHVGFQGKFSDANMRTTCRAMTALTDKRVLDYGLLHLIVEYHPRNANGNVRILHDGLNRYTAIPEKHESYDSLVHALFHVFDADLLVRHDVPEKSRTEILAHAKTDITYQLQNNTTEILRPILDAKIRTYAPAVPTVPQEAPQRVLQQALPRPISFLETNPRNGTTYIKGTEVRLAAIVAMSLAGETPNNIASELQIAPEIVRVALEYAKENPTITEKNLHRAGAYVGNPSAPNFLNPSNQTFK